MFFLHAAMWAFKWVMQHSVVNMSNGWLSYILLCIYTFSYTLLLSLINSSIAYHPSLTGMLCDTCFLHGLPHNILYLIHFWKLPCQLAATAAFAMTEVKKKKFPPKNSSCAALRCLKYSLWPVGHFFTWGVFDFVGSRWEDVNVKHLPLFRKHGCSKKMHIL